MDAVSFLIQLLNGVQYGFLLFLVASGLTLIFGIMGVINLSHGSFYMLGAYLVYWFTGVTDNFFLALIASLPVMVAFGFVVEKFAISFLYNRDHLYQVLLTFGLILILNETQKILWGTEYHGVPIPDILAGGIPLDGTQVYPVYRLFISLICLGVAAGLFLIIKHTRLGMMIRAGADNREMTQALGIDISRIFAIVFGLGAGLAGLAGMIGAPVSSVYPGMGDHILIISFVVVVIGGIGSIKGAFAGAMLIGLADTFGKVLLPDLSSMVVYALMVLVLIWRPQGLYGRPQ